MDLIKFTTKSNTNTIENEDVKMFPCFYQKEWLKATFKSYHTIISKLPKCKSDVHSL